MKEFEIVIKEELARVIKVKAENLEAALDNVAERYYRGEIVLDAEDFAGKEIALFCKRQIRREFRNERNTERENIESTRQGIGKAGLYP